MLYSIFLVLFILSTLVVGGSEYGIAVLYPQYSGILFKFDPEGRNMHLQQRTDQAQNIKIPMVQMEPRNNDATSVTKNKFVPQIDPQKCEGNTFCEEADYYPYHEVDNQLAQAGESEYKYIFGVDDVQLTSKMDGSILEGTSGDVLHPICETKMRIIFPKIARNKRNEWKYVVNQDVEKVQGIAVEWCKKTGDRCNYLTSKLKYMIPTCGQKYSFRRLLTLSHEGYLESDVFEFPVACMCYVKSYLFAN